MKSEATMSATTADAPGPMQISVSDVEALYDAIDNPNNAGKTIVLQPKPTPYVLTRHKGTQERLNQGRLELQRNMSLIGGGNLSMCVLETSPTDIPIFNVVAGARSGMIRVGRGEHTIGKLRLNVPGIAGSGISTDLNDSHSQETTVRIEKVISGDPTNSHATRGVDIRNTGTTVPGRRLKAVIKNCEFFGGTQGIRIANFQRADDCQVSVEMSGNNLHKNGTGCIITHHTSTSGVIEVHSHDDSFTDNGTGCAVIGPINRGTSPLITSSNRTVLIAYKMVCESNGSAADPMNGYQGGVVIRGADTTLANVAFKNQVEITLKDCTFNSNGPKGDVIAHGAFSTDSSGVAGTENTVTISLRNQNSFSLDATHSQPPESGSPTNKVIVTS